MNRRKFTITAIVGALLGGGTQADAQIPAKALANPGGLPKFENGYCPVCGTKSRPTPKAVKMERHMNGFDIEPYPIYDWNPVAPAVTGSFTSLKWYVEDCQHCGCCFRVKVGGL